MTSCSMHLQRLMMVAALLTIACSQPDLTAPDGALAAAKPDKPGGGGGGSDGGGTTVPAIDIGTLGGRSSSAAAINNDGYVVGRADRTDGRSVGFVWREGEGMRELGGLAGAESSFPNDINAAKLVVGYADIDAAAILLRAISWTYDGQGWGAPAVLPSLPGLEGDAAANAVNAAGDIVGMNYPFQNGTGTVVVWQQGMPQAVLSGDGATNYYASDINDSGWIVGFMKDRAINLNMAFVWIPDVLGSYGSGRLVALPRVGTANNVAVSVGNGGVIVGYAGLLGATTAVRWTPQVGIPDGPEDFIAQTLPGNYANGVNAEGYVTGQKSSKGGSAQGFMWAPNGAVSTLAPGSSKGHTEPGSINDARWIVGRSGIRATLWKAP